MLVPWYLIPYHLSVALSLSFTVLVVSVAACRTRYAAGCDYGYGSYEKVFWNSITDSALNPQPSAARS